MTLSPLEQRAVEAAVPAWIAANEVVRDRNAHPGGYQGETADRILARYGIRHWDDPARYRRCEAEIVRRAYLVIGPPGPTFDPSLDIRTCDACGEDYPRKPGLSRPNFRQQRFCSRGCYNRSQRGAA